ncbi:MAG: hypothetical protein ACI31R_04450 [Bacilli bacterium]
MDNIKVEDLSNEELIENYKTILEFINFLDSELINIKKEVGEEDE